MSGLTRTNCTSIFALGLIHAFGMNCMYGLVYRNGYIKALLKLRDQGPYVIPGSAIPILTTFTGIRPLDKVLTLAGVMFANINDGSTPQLSLCAFHFAGQLVSIFTFLLIEGRRTAISGVYYLCKIYSQRECWQFCLLSGTDFRESQKCLTSARSVLWGCAMQDLGYGFAMPLYAITHLLTSTIATIVSPVLADAVLTRDLNYVENLTSSILIGYILPSILMMAPVSSAALHQWLAGFWQGFPVWISLLQYTWGFRHNGLSSAISKDCESSDTRRSSLGDRISETKTLHEAYLFAFMVSALTQFSTFGIIWCRNFSPSLISPTLTFRNVFVPPVFDSRVPMKNLAIGIQNFFQYDQYVGSAAAIVWAITLQCNSRMKPLKLKHWMWFVGEVLGVGLIAGPGGAVVSLMWNRDERIISEDDLYEGQEL